MCCVKLQKRVNADFHKIQYFYFSRICVKLKISYLRNFMRNIFVFFQKISEENNFCENFEKKLLRLVVCCVKLQKRVNADFHKIQYFLFFKNLCKFKNLSFCENVEIKTFEDCFVLCKNAKTR